MDSQELEDIIVQLLRRPGHEMVRALLYRLLTGGLGANPADINFERAIPEIGRIDALLGRTIIEIKTDLRRELFDAEAQLKRYMADRQSETNSTFIGLITDGAEFRIYDLQNSLRILTKYIPSSERPRDLLLFLEAALHVNATVDAHPGTVRMELGRESVLFNKIAPEIERLWLTLADNPEVQLKRDLWDRLLNVVYGKEIEFPELFIQHTYLTVVAKSIATLALLGELPDDAADLLEGRAFSHQGIFGAVESDFFDWLLHDPSGRRIVLYIAQYVSRFQFTSIEVDVLKSLYESLIDPGQRHDLGEYYTPDWLAGRIVDRMLQGRPTARVLDPSCGSGTFLFHAVRWIIARERDTLRIADILGRVRGIDIHPVAVIFARATYLLALMPILKGRDVEQITVPVFLGDALQWNTREFMNVRDLEIVVPSTVGRNKKTSRADNERSILRFPSALARDPTHYDTVIGDMLRAAVADEGEGIFRERLAPLTFLSPADRNMLVSTYKTLRQLQKEGRNHIWGYVARNFARPLWLSSDTEKSDVLVGNPPWLDYRQMNVSTQEAFKERMQEIGLWDDKVPGLAFDLSAYFFARAVHLYLRPTGAIAFVMPAAALTRKAYSRFRTGSFNRAGQAGQSVRFTAAWLFTSEVGPLFPVPSSVLFADGTTHVGPLPNSVDFFFGRLPRRDAGEQEAEASLERRTQPWPPIDDGSGSVYRAMFRAGAKLDPRRLVLVERVQEKGRLTASAHAPVVVGRTGVLDKKPWNKVRPPKGPVEEQFVRPVLLGESIAPFRILRAVEGVIPWSTKTNVLMDSAAAARRGHKRLAEWLDGVEKLWDRHGMGKTTFLKKINYSGYLSNQFPIASIRVVYAKSGTYPAACIVEDAEAVIDHMLYWAAVEEPEEGNYLSGMLNSEALRQRILPMMAEGDFGPRHFDKVFFNLHIPRFDAKQSQHRDVSRYAAEAAVIAASISIDEDEDFKTSRKRIRAAVATVTTKMDQVIVKIVK